MIRHRTDEERSSVYERLMELEEAAKAAKRGIHSNKVRPEVAGRMARVCWATPELGGCRSFSTLVQK